MKKLLSITLLILLMFNFIFCYNVYAVPTSPAGGEREGSRLQDSFASENAAMDNTLSEKAAAMGDGEGDDGANSKANGSSSSSTGTFMGIVSRAVNIIALEVDVLISHLANNPTKSGGASSIKQPKNEMFWFSIDKTVFNRVPLFNINYFDTEESYEIGGGESVYSDTNNIAVKDSIVVSYYVCRLISLGISLVVLIYIGIRMAISSVASDQAKYKKMLISWIESIIILFVMPYIMSAIFVFGESLTKIFYGIRNSLLGTTVPGAAGTYDVFEETVRKKLFGKVYNDSGISLAVWSLVYWVLLFTELKFLWLYLKRLLMVGFLIVISPIITITYSIDKVGDGKAQAFGIWLKEFILNVLIQPLHALLYIVFVFSANAIAATSPLVGLALLLAMGQAERMVKVVFDMKGSVTLRGVNKFMKKEG